jgi:hypothetical protein
MARNRIIIRSVYLFGETLVDGVYEGGLEEFYGHLYPDGGPLTAYTLAAESFLESGFGAEAAAAYDRALGAADRAMHGPAAPPRRTAHRGAGARMRGTR